MALAYGNRSAVFFELNKYEESLLNIQWAKECDYPTDKIDKLNEREEKCKQILSSKPKDPADDPMEFFKLSYPPNPKIPFLIDGIELRKTEKYGRGLYAKQDLKAGDVIAWEEMSFKRVFCSGQYNRCCYCLKCNMMNLIPCSKTASLMFCSIECRDKTYKIYGDEIDSMVVYGDMQLNSDRILIDFEQAFGGRKQFLKFLNENDIQKIRKSVFDFDWNEEEMIEKFRIISLLSLEIPKGIPALLFTFTSPTFKVAKGSEEYLSLIGHVSQVITSNSTTIVYEHFQVSKQMCPQAIHDGITVLIISGLINHSCMNNVDRVIMDNKVFYYAAKPIKKGEQLFASYL